MPQATFNGQTYNFPEGTSQNDMLAYINAKNGTSQEPAPQEQAPVEDSSWGIYKDGQDGSLVDTMKAGFNRLGANVVSSLVNDSEESSNYAMARAKKASQAFRQENEKLGTAGQIVAGAGVYAPVIAAGAVNPVAGAAVMSGMQTADALAAQQENNQDYNWMDAGAAGLASGAVDYATAGLAGRGVNLAQQLSRPTARVAAELGSQAAQGSASNGFAQAFTNMASGRPWGENVGEAMTIGGVAGGGIHAGIKAGNSLVGINRSLGIEPNEGGKAAIQRDLELEQAGAKIAPDYRNQAIEYDNLMSAANQRLGELRGGEDASGAVQDYVNTALNKGTASSIQQATKVMLDNGMPINAKAFDLVRGEGLNTAQNTNLATDVHGLDGNQIRTAGESIYKLKTPTYFGREAALDAGLTTAAQQKKIQNGYQSGVNQLMAPFRTGLLDLQKLQASDSLKGLDTTKLSMAIRDMSDLNKMAQNALHPDRRPTVGEIRGVSTSLMRNLHEANLVNEIKGLDGKPGTFNPVHALETLQNFHDMSANMYPSVRDGNPDALAAGAQSDRVSGTDVAMDAGLMTLGLPPIRTIGRQIIHAREVTKRQKGLQRAQEEGRQLAESWVNPPNKVVHNEAAQRGDFEGAAQEADADLASMGINTGEAKRQSNLSPEPVVAPVEAAPIVEPVVAQEAPQVRGDAELAAAMARTPERMPEPVPEPIQQAVAPEPMRGTSDPSLDAEFASRRPLEPVQEEVVAPVVQEDVVQTPNPRELAEAQAARQEQVAMDARVDSQRRATREAPVEEAPQKAPQETYTKEEPTTAPQEDKPRTKSSDLALKPLKDRIEKFQETKGKDQPQMAHSKWLKDKELVQKINDAVDVHAKKNPELNSEDIFSIINDMGGVGKLTENNQTPSAGLTTLLKEYQIKSAKKAEADAKRVNEIADDEIGKVTDEAKEVATKRITDSLVSKGVDRGIIEEAFTRARKEIGDDFEPNHVLNFARRIADEKAKVAKEAEKAAEVKTSSTGKPATMSRTISDSRKALTNYADSLGIGDDAFVKSTISKATRSLKDDAKALSESAERSVLNKIHEYIDGQIANYEAALKAPKTLQPVELAKYKATLGNWKDYKGRIKGAEDNFSGKIKAHKEDAAKKAAAIEKSDKAKAEADEAVKQANTVKDAVEGGVDTKLNIDGEKVQSRIEKALTKEFADLSPLEIQAVFDSFVSKMPEDLSGINDPAFAKSEAIMEATSKALREVGRKDPALAISNARKALRSGLERKTEFPDNPELWMSTTERDAISDSLTGDVGTSTYYGRLYQKLRGALFGFENSKHYVDYTQKALDRKIKERRAASGKDIGEGGINAAGIK